MDNSKNTSNNGGNIASLTSNRNIELIESRNSPSLFSIRNQSDSCLNQNNDLASSSSFLVSTTIENSNEETLEVAYLAEQSKNYLNLFYSNNLEFNENEQINICLTNDSLEVNEKYNTSGFLLNEYNFDYSQSEYYDYTDSLLHSINNIIITREVKRDIISEPYNHPEFIESWFLFGLNYIIDAGELSYSSYYEDISTYINEDPFSFRDNPINNKDVYYYIFEYLFLESRNNLDQIYEIFENTRLYSEDISYQFLSNYGYDIEDHCQADYDCYRYFYEELTGNSKLPFEVAFDAANFKDHNGNILTLQGLKNNFYKNENWFQNYVNTRFSF